MTEDVKTRCRVLFDVTPKVHSSQDTFRGGVKTAPILKSKTRNEQLAPLVTRTVTSPPILPNHRNKGTCTKPEHGQVAVPLNNDNYVDGRRCSHSLHLPESPKRT